MIDLIGDFLPHFRNRFDFDIISLFQVICETLQ